MLNQIEKQFEGFMSSMYKDITISESQEKDMGKSFYAGMFVCHQMITSLNDDEDIAIKQMDQLTNEILEKIGDFTNV